MDVLYFTLIESILSTLISVGLGFLLAWSFTWSSSILPKLFKTLLTLPLLAPSIVGLLGYITLFSNKGIFGNILPLYGMGGIVGAHTFFYTPFVAIFLSQAWKNIPYEHFLLVRQLNLSKLQSLRLVEFPVVKYYFLTVSWLIFCMALASFTTVLVLGGGPQSTTLPVAIYQSLFNDLEFQQAFTFASIQLSLCVAAYGIIYLLPKPPPLPTTYIHSPARSCPITTTITVGLSIILLLPLGIIFLQSISQVSNFFNNENILALQKSLFIGVISGSISTGLAFTGLILSSGSKKLFSLIGSLFFIIPLPLFGFGAFWIQYYWEALPSFPIIIFLNILLTLPFALHFLRDPLTQVSSSYGAISTSLGLNQKQQTLLIFIPLLKKPIGQSLGFCSALAAGELSVLLMFPDYDSPGLSSLLYQQMGGYRSGEAMTTACQLLLLCLFLIFSFQTIFKDRQHARV